MEHALHGIVVSGKPVSGKSTLVELVSLEYAMPVYSVGQYWREKHRLAYPDGSVPFEEYWKGRSDAENMAANVGLRRLAEEKGYIVDTRYASIFDMDNCLTLFVDAPLDVRADRAASMPGYEGKPIHEIKEILRNREEDEADVGKRLFNSDYRNPELYHIIIDSGACTPREELSIVRKEMNDRMSLARR